MSAAIRMTLAVAIVFTVFMGLLFSQPVRSEPLETYDFNDAAKATYQLFVNEKPKCSGVFIASSKERDLFLTAAHCGESIARYSLRLKGEDGKLKPHTLRKVRLHIDSDVMLFQTASPAHKVFNVAPLATASEVSTLKFGDELIALGYAHATEILMTKGQFMEMSKGVVSPATNQIFIRASNALMRGMSGGGLWMKSPTGDLRLIGLNSHGILHNPNSRFASYDSIMAILNGVFKGV